MIFSILNSVAFVAVTFVFHLIFMVPGAVAAEAEDPVEFAEFAEDGVKDKHKVKDKEDAKSKHPEKNDAAYVAKKYARQLDYVIKKLKSGELELANAATVEPKAYVAYVLESKGGLNQAKRFMGERDKTIAMYQAIRDGLVTVTPLLTDKGEKTNRVQISDTKSGFSGPQIFLLTEDAMYLIPHVVPDIPW